MESCDPVVLTTGSDEHSRNVERAAKAAISPEDLHGEDGGWNSPANGGSLHRLPITFIRTSDPKHHETVRDLFQRCQRNGYITRVSYTGQYCVNDELYVNDAKPRDTLSGVRDASTETVTEENYFFSFRPSRIVCWSYTEESGTSETGSPPQRDCGVCPTGVERSFDHANPISNGEFLSQAMRITSSMCGSTL